MDSSLGLDLEGRGDIDCSGRGAGPQIESPAVQERLASRANTKVLLRDPGRVQRQRQGGTRTPLLLTFTRCLLKKMLQIQKKVFSGIILTSNLTI